MIRLLIVDDEPYTVEGLYDMLSEASDLGLELYCVYSAEEALQRLVWTKMDIVLSDISMPGMDGIELQQRIHARWSRCKVIFLTGIGDISYIQQAMRGGGVDYILKTEGDEAIIESIRKAIARLEEEARNDRYILQARDQVRQALPLLRRDWFNRISDSDHSPASLSADRFEELELLLSPDRRLLLVMGRMDSCRDKLSPSDRTLFGNAVQNIAEEYLRPLTFQPIMLSDWQFIWLLQPARSEDGAYAPDSEEQWVDTQRFVIGMLESIQTTSKSLLHLSFSFVTTGESSSWAELPGTYQTVKNAMLMGLGNGEEMLITRCDTVDRQDLTTVLSERLLSDLKLLIESGQQAEFNEMLDRCFERVPNHLGLYTQTYYSVAVLLLEQINGPASGLPVEGDTVDKLMDLGSHASKELAIGYLKDVAGQIFTHRAKTLDERTHRIVHILNQHLREHLNDDLSLDALADLVYLNPSYLSALYKQYTGTNISDHIAELRVEKAKNLLANPQLKIHEIASAIGFGTAGYFTRFFKKHVGTTPQEYRSAHESWN